MSSVEYDSDSSNSFRENSSENSQDQEYQLEETSSSASTQPDQQQEPEETHRWREGSYDFALVRGTANGARLAVQSIQDRLGWITRQIRELSLEPRSRSPTPSATETEPAEPAERSYGSRRFDSPPASHYPTTTRFATYDVTHFNNLHQEVDWIQLQYRPFYYQNCPPRVKQLISMLMIEGLGETSANTLVNCWGTDVWATLTSLPSYFADQNNVDAQYSALNLGCFVQVDNLAQVLDMNRVHMVSSSPATFRSMLLVMFPLVGDVRQEFERCSRQGRRQYVYARMAYLYFVANMVECGMVDRAIVFQRLVYRQLLHNVRHIPCIRSDWKWRQARVSRSTTNKLHFSLNSIA